MSIKPVSSADRQLLALCQQTCATLKAKYVSMNDIIPRVEVYSITFDPAKGMRNHTEKMEKFGMRWLRYMKVLAPDEVWRSACSQAVARLMPEGRGKELTRMLAETTKGNAQCEAISLLAIKELRALVPYKVNILPDPSINDQPDSPIDDELLELLERVGHCFNLVGVTRSDLEKAVRLGEKTNIFDFLDKLNKGVILDASLNCVCLVSQYREKAGPLLEYIQKHETVLVGDVENTQSNPKFFENITPRVEEVCTLAEQLLPQVQMCATTKFYFRAAIDESARQMTHAHGIISQQFAKVTWKMKGGDTNTIEWSVWTQGPVAQVQAIGEHLKSIGAQVSANKVKNKDSYGVIFKDPDPLELSVLFATEQLFAAATGKLANIITRYAEK